jgi:hypothetical protein
MATPTTLPSTFVASQVLTAAQMNNLRGAFRILQVVTTAKTDTFTSSSTTMTDITGMSVTITPSATSSLILILSQLSISGQNATAAAFYQLVRGSTAIGIGDTAGSRSRLTGATGADGISRSQIVSFVDNPATTSATTYKFQARASATGSFYVNRFETDTDAASSPRLISTITAFEISA